MRALRLSIVSRSEVTTKNKSGAQENVDSTVYEPGIDGRLQLSGRRVATITTKSDGSQVEEIDVYGRTIGYAADANAAAPRLQQQILKEKVVRPDGSVVESTNVRSRVSHDSDRMSNYEKTTETSTVATDAAGRHRQLAQRLVEVEISVVALGENARWLQAAPLGGALKATGFLAARSRNSKSPVLHVNTLEFLEGNENGSILQEEG